MARSWRLGAIGFLYQSRLTAPYLANGQSVGRPAPGRSETPCAAVINEFTVRPAVLGIIAFLWAQKLWWMIPLVVMLLLLAALVAFASATSLGPFI